MGLRNHAANDPAPEAFDSPGARAPVAGVTPRTLLHRRGTLGLYHYTPAVDEVFRVPLLLVMAPTNRVSIFDLAPGRSLIAFLLGRGYDIHVIDWNPPAGEERYLKFENYVLDFIPDCVERVGQHSGVEDVSIVGYCMGGVLSAIYAALHPGGPLKNLVCLATPVDFRQMPLFHTLTDPRRFDVDRLVDTLGIIPPKIVATGFDRLSAAAPTRSHDSRGSDTVEVGAARMMMARWAAETLPLAGEYYRQMVKDLIRNNGLYDNTLRVGGRAVDLRDITASLLHILADDDHIVAPACGAPLVALAGSRDKQDIIVPGGHAGLVAGADALTHMAPQLDRWLERRSI